MRRHSQVLMAAAALVVGSAQALGQQGGWRGQRVVIKFGTALMVNGRVVDNQKLETTASGYRRSTFGVYRVERVKGRRLWLVAEDRYVSGWVPVARVVRFDRAIDYFTRQIEANPRDGTAYAGRGLIWAEMSEFDKAIADYTEAIRIDPWDEVAYDNRGRAWSAKGHLDKAIADHSEAIRLDPSYYWPYINRGMDLYLNGEYARAIADDNEAIRLDPQDPTAYNNLAWHQATCPDPKYRDGQRAVDLATHACELSQWKEPLYIGTLAAAAAETGDFATAIKHQEKALARYRKETERDLGRKLLALYQALKPYREGPGANSAGLHGR